MRQFLEGCPSKEVTSPSLEVVILDIIHPAQRLTGPARRLRLDEEDSAGEQVVTAARLDLEEIAVIDPEIPGQVNDSDHAAVPDIASGVALHLDRVSDDDPALDLIDADLPAELTDSMLRAACVA